MFKLFFPLNYQYNEWSQIFCHMIALSEKLTEFKVIIH